MRPARALLLAAIASCAAAPAAAQIGEVQVGALGSYGTAEAWRTGGGLVVGLAAGRVAYLGLRWVRYGGSTTWRSPGQPPVAVVTRIQNLTADLGVMIPVGPVDLIPAVSLGGARFTQTSRDTAGSPWHATEFYAAPGVAAEIHAGRLALIPEIQYAFAGHPDRPGSLPFPGDHRGLLASLRLVATFEVGRVRH